MSGLKAIILHNSYIAGKRTRIDCDGHTIIQGDNGAGKTSALRLFPIFYGRSPRYVMERTGGKQNFVDYYLPHMQSMIVFEYARVDGKVCCSVIYRTSDQSTYAYRFIPGSANDTIFHPDMQDCFESGTPAYQMLGGELTERRGIKTSIQINNTREYEAILLNDWRYMRQRTGSHRLTTLRNNFSLGNSDDRMSNLGELTSVTMQGNQLLSHLKEMIIDTMIRKSISQAHRYQASVDTNIWKEIESLKAFQKQIPKIREGVSQYAEAQQIRSELITYVDALQEAIGRQQDILDEAVNQKSVLDSRLTETEAQSKSETEALTGQISALEAKRNRNQLEVNAFEADEQKWKARNTEEAAAAIRSLPEKQARRNELLERVRILEEGAANISQEFDRLKGEKETEQAARIQNINNEKRALNRKIFDLWEQERKERDELLARFKLQREAIKHEEEAQLAEQRKLASQLREALQAAYEATDEEKLQAEQANRQVEKAETELDRVRAERDTATETLRQEKEKLRSIETDISRADERLVRLRTDIERLERQLKPEQGTLLHFLRTHEEGWEQTIGRVIDQSLLDRSDLEPSLDDGDGSIYGLSINLDALDPIDARLDLDRLQEALERKQEEKRSVETELEGLRSAFAEQRKRLREREHSVELLAASSQRHATAVQESRKSEVALRQKHKAQAEERVRVAREAMAQQDETAAELRKQFNIKLQDIDAAEKNASVQLEEQFTKARAEVEENIEALTRQIEELRKQHEQDLLDLAEERSHALRKEGVDTEHTEKLRKEAESLYGEILALKRRQNEIDEYLRWKELAPGRRLELLTESAALDAQIKDLGQKLSETRAHFRRKIQDMSESLQTLIKQIRQYEAAINEWRSTHKSAIDILIRIPADSLYAFRSSVTLDGLEPREIASRTDKRRVNLEEATDRVTQIVREIYSSMQSMHGTKAYDSWRTSAEDYRERFGTGARDFADICAFRDLIDQFLPDIVRTHNEVVLYLARNYLNHRDWFDQVRRAARTASRKFENSLNTSHEFKEISDISLELFLAVEGDAGVYELERLARFEEELKDLERDREKLPSDSLARTLERLGQVLRENHADNDKQNLERIVGMRITLVENGRQVRIRSDNDLKNASSTGLSLIAIMIIFSALTRYLCPNRGIKISWPIDEIGRIHSINLRKLMNMMSEQNIVLVTAEPETSGAKLKCFQNHFNVDLRKGVRIEAMRKSNENRFLKVQEQGELV